MSGPIPRTLRISVSKSGSGRLGGPPPQLPLTDRDALWNEKTIRSRNDQLGGQLDLRPLPFATRPAETAARFPETPLHSPRS